MRFRAAIMAGGLFLGSAICAEAQTLASVTRDSFLLSPDADRDLTVRDVVATRTGISAKTSRVTTRKRDSGAVDTLVLTTERTLQSPGYGAVAPEDAIAEGDRDVTYIRQWPGAASVSGPGYRLDVTPEAGVTYGSNGGSAQAGATVRLTPAERDARLVAKLARMGIVEGDETYGEDEGRWYLFAAARGRGVGLNMARGERSMSTDPVAITGDAQIGVGWRKDDLQASVGYTRRSLKSRDAYINMIAEDRDEIVGLSLSYVPGR